MKRVIFFICCTCIVSLCTAQSARYEITGKIEGSDGELFLLQRLVNGKPVRMDSAKSVKGVFIMNKGSVEFPEMVNLSVTSRKQNVMFFLENRKITIEGKIDSLQKATITGSKTQDELMVYRALLQPIDEKRIKLTNDFQAASAAILKDIKEVQINYIREHPASFTVPQLLRSLYTEIPPGDLDAILKSLDPAVAATPAVKEVEAKANLERVVSIGQKAPDFTLNDLNSRPVSLSSLKGYKVLLIDFWAAWCKPCRAENPYIVKIYNEFHGKGFDILGVSLDRKKEDWKNAIVADKLVWKQVSDLMYFSGPVVKKYNVTSIPASYLLDEKGVIIAKNLRGDELYNRVKSMVTAE